MIAFVACHPNPSSPNHPCSPCPRPGPVKETAAKCPSCSRESKSRSSCPLQYTALTLIEARGSCTRTLPSSILFTQSIRTSGTPSPRNHFLPSLRRARQDQTRWHHSPQVETRFDLSKYLRLLHSVTSAHISASMSHQSFTYYSMTEMSINQRSQSTTDRTPASLPLWIMPRVSSGH